MLVFLVGTFANVTIAYLIMTVIVDNRSNTPVVIKNINWREPFAVVMCPMPNNPLRWQLTEESYSTHSTCETSARDLPSCLPQWQRPRVYELLFPLHLGDDAYACTLQPVRPHPSVVHMCSRQ